MSALCDNRKRMKRGLSTSVSKLVELMNVSCQSEESKVQLQILTVTPQLTTLTCQRIRYISENSALPHAHGTELIPEVFVIQPSLLNEQQHTGTTHYKMIILQNHSLQSGAVESAPMLNTIIFIKLRFSAALLFQNACIFISLPNELVSPCDRSDSIFWLGQQPKCLVSLTFSCFKISIYSFARNYWLYHYYAAFDTATLYMQNRRAARQLLIKMADETFFLKAFFWPTAMI